MQNEIAFAVENHQFDIGISREKPYSTKIYTEKICEGRIALFVPKCDSHLTEMELLQKYTILSDNHPLYWSQVKQEISERVPEARFTSIRDISMTEKLIEMEQGISYLPAYLNTAFDSKITSRQIEEISTPVSFTYLITNKNSEEISYFCQQFKDFVLAEQNRVQ